MNTAEGSASEVLEVNFFDGIILPRATPAWSGVMHSMSSMPRHSSQALASFQFFTPRSFFRKAGVRARPPRLDGRTSFFSGGIIHQIVLRISKYSRALRGKGRGGATRRASVFRLAACRNNGYTGRP